MPEVKTNERAYEGFNHRSSGLFGTSDTSVFWNEMQQDVTSSVV